jgi:nitrogen-specific signal transduction histidine kinase
MELEGSALFTRRNKLWGVSLIALVVAQIAASALMPTGTALMIASDLIAGTLLLIAFAAFVPKTSGSRPATLHIRVFWILMSAGMCFWLVYQGMWNYFEVLKRVDVPNPFLGDVVLFLHLVPMIAALAVLPHLREEDRNERIRLLDFALLLTWWVFVYVYAVIPWQMVQFDETRYSLNFNLAYLTEKLVLLTSLSILAYTADGGWRRLYTQLLGASALYAASSYVANWAIEHKLYYSGSLYDVPLAVAMAWMGAIPLFADHLDLSDSKPPQPLLGLWITRLSMLALFSLLWAAVHAELDASLPPAVKSFRITVSLFTMVVMGIVVFWRQRLLRAELSLFLEKSRRSFNELKALQGQLIQSEKLASLGQLVGGAAHEINNPLTAMLGYSELLSASNLPAEEQLQAVQIGEQVRRTTTLVASLLTFARQAPARLAQVDINSVLQTAARLMAARLEADAMTVHLDLASSLPPVLADSNQILHVCLHLAGQVNTRDGEQRSTLLIRTWSQSDVVVIEFSPNNKISQDSSDVPQFRSLLDDGMPKPTSLSLSACCRIVEEHGGRLLQPLDPGNSAFRVELQAATTANNRTSFGAWNRAAGSSGS